MGRKYTAKYQMSDHRNDDYIQGTPAYRLGLVWTLTKEITSLSKKYDAKRRLQRHVTRLIFVLKEYKRRKKSIKRNKTIIYIQR